MKKTLLSGSFASLCLLCACAGGGNPEAAGRPVSLDSLERRNVAMRPLCPQAGYDPQVCVRAYPVPMLADSTPFAWSHYSFVRTAPNRGYELCRYDEHSVLEIEQGGCEYFLFTFRWSYNGIAQGTPPSELYRRALLDTKAAGRYCAGFGEDIAAGADTLLARLQAGGTVPGRTLDFRRPTGDFYYKVAADTLLRFSDAAVVGVTYTLGPL